MKILLLGADGQVGHELRATLACFADVDAASRREVDLAQLDVVRRAVADASPDVIVNAAAYNDVDGAEKDEAGARRVNCEAVAVLGEEAKKRRAALIHYSTDFVFDGEKQQAYVESDEPHPLGAYGRSKLAGERALVELEAPALVLRTSWVWSLRRKSFVSAMLKLARERETLRVVADQVGNPTYCRDLAVATALLLYGVRRDPFGAISAARGIYHLAGRGFCTRHELARAALELDPGRAAHTVKHIEPIASTEYPLPARRPTYAPLDCDKARQAFGISLPDWRQSLAAALAG